MQQEQCMAWVISEQEQAKCLCKLSFFWLFFFFFICKCWTKANWYIFRKMQEGFCCPLCLWLWLRSFTLMSGIRGSMGQSMVYKFYLMVHTSAYTQWSTHAVKVFSHSIWCIWLHAQSNEIKVEIMLHWFLFFLNIPSPPRQDLSLATIVVFTWGFIIIQVCLLCTLGLAFIMFKTGKDQ